MPTSIAVFGAGPGLGRAVAHRYAQEGYTVVLVARRREPLERLAGELTRAGASAHAIPADLSDTDGLAALAEWIRTTVGDLDAFYYGPTSGRAQPAATLTPADLQALMPFGLYALVALVREFLPHMISRGGGAILAATGASAVQGMPNFSGPGPALAAQRNYLQSLQAEVADDGVYVGRLYIGAPIQNSAWHARIQADEAAGRPTPRRGPAVDPNHLADLLWTMHNTTKQAEATYRTASPTLLRLGRGSRYGTPVAGRPVRSARRTTRRLLADAAGVASPIRRSRAPAGSGAIPPCHGQREQAVTTANRVDPRPRQCLWRHFGAGFTTRQ